MTADSDEEDFVVYGTPLEPLDEDTIPKKRAVKVEDQVAKDKHGRRRFHGAFTGGFSAGFFNTVGSLEGWKPSQFKSSRSSKSTSQFQRPEDFMDDEDMDEFGIAPKIIRPTGDYNQPSEGPSRKRTLMHFSDGPIPGIPVLRTLIEPVRETIGIQLLMKMGWKPGQGVGPRLFKAEKFTLKKLSKPVKVYGCVLPDQNKEPNKEVDSDSEDEENFDTDVTFAPDDYAPYIVRPKDDFFGLGYSGLDRRPVLSSHINLFEPTTSSLVMQEKKKKVSIRGQAFGVGAFEREDEDIYASEDMSQYDFALDTPKMLAEKRQQDRNARLALPPSSSDVLEGFLVMSHPLTSKKYPPPPLPQNFSPRHQIRQSRFSGTSTQDVQGNRPRLLAIERAVMVNESTPPPPPSSQKNVIQEEPQPLEVERTVNTFRPFVADMDKQLRYEKFLTLSKLGQTEKLSSLQPLTMTEWERERERSEFTQAARLYRPLSAAFSDRFVSASLPDESTDPLAPVARTSGIDDSIKNAAKYKMFGRLTRTVSEWQPHSILCKRFNVPQPGGTGSSKQVKTSRPTFSVFNFLDAAPFNASGSSYENAAASEVIPEKSAETDLTATSTTLDVPEVQTAEDDNFEKLVESTNKMDLYKAIFLSSSDESDNDDDNTMSSASVQPMTSQRTDIKNASPPRGVFANLNFNNKTSQEINSLTISQEKTATEVNVLRNTSPPRGIFANLDLNALSTQEKKPLTIHTEENNAVKVNLSHNTSPPRGIFANLNVDPLNKQGQSTNSNSNDNNNSLRNNLDKNQQSPELLPEDLMFGPALPPNFTLPQHTEAFPRSFHLLDNQSRVSKDDSSESDSEEEWVESNKLRDSDKSHRHSSKTKHSKKSHRKSKKHKEKKHKHKKKRK